MGHDENTAPPDEQRAIETAIEAGLGEDDRDVTVPVDIAHLRDGLKADVRLLTDQEIEEARKPFPPYHDSRFGVDTFWYRNKAYRVIWHREPA